MKSEMCCLVPRYVSLAGNWEIAHCWLQDQVELNSNRLTSLVEYKTFAREHNQSKLVAQAYTERG